MYLELRKKIREYKSNSDDFQIEPNVMQLKKNLWDYDVGLKNDTHPFLSSYVDITQRSSYKLEGFAKEELKKREKDVFAKECYGNKGIISSIMQAECVDSDWLNGVFLAQEIISQLAFNKFTVEINTWHNGCQSGLLNGFNHFCKSSLYSSHKKLGWNWKGFDIMPNEKLPEDNVLIGAVGNGDITVGGNIIYLSNKIKEDWKDGADVVFHDIYPKNEQILLSGLMSSIMFLNNKGFVVIRLPEPELWNTNVINCMLIVCMIFNNVKLWSPKWGRREKSFKYYLVAFKKKKTIYRSNYRAFLKIMKNADEDKQFLKKLVHDDLEVKEWLEILQNIKNEMINSNEEIVSSDWIDIIMSNVLTLTKKL